MTDFYIHKKYSEFDIKKKSKNRFSFHKVLIFIGIPIAIIISLFILIVTKWGIGGNDPLLIIDKSNLNNKLITKNIDSNKIVKKPEIKQETKATNNDSNRANSSVDTIDKTVKPEKKIYKPKVKMPVTFDSTLKNIEDMAKNLINLMEEKDANRNYNEVLALYNYLPVDESQKIKPLILRHRAIAKLYELTEDYFKETHIDDAEFIIAKIEHLYRKEKYIQALTLLKKTKRISTIYASKNILKQQFLLYEARIITKLLNSSHPRVTDKMALSYWHKVKKKFKRSSKKQYINEADAEIQKINARKLIEQR